MQALRVIFHDRHVLADQPCGFFHVEKPVSMSWVEVPHVGKPVLMSWLTSQHLPKKLSNNCWAIWSSQIQSDFEDVGVTRFLNSTQLLNSGPFFSSCMLHEASQAEMKVESFFLRWLGLF